MLYLPGVWQVTLKSKCNLFFAPLHRRHIIVPLLFSNHSSQWLNHVDEWILIIRNRSGHHASWNNQVSKQGHLTLSKCSLSNNVGAYVRDLPFLISIWVIYGIIVFCRLLLNG